MSDEKLVHPIWLPVANRFCWRLAITGTDKLLRKGNGRVYRFQTSQGAIEFAQHRKGVALFNPEEHTELRDRLLAERGQVSSE